MTDSAYSAAKSGSLKLKLKGESSSSSHKHKKSKKKKSDKERSRDDDATNIKEVGWVVENIDQITGSVFIEFIGNGSYMYMHSLENGVVVMGPPHQAEDAPDTEEIFSAIRVDEHSHIALKSTSLGKYLSINSNGLLVARSEAISPKEYFEVVIDYDYDGRKFYLKANNDRYVTMNSEGDLVAQSSEKSDEAALRIRSLSKKESKSSVAKRALPEEEQADDLVNVELNYVKKFQKFQDKKIKLNKEDVGELYNAREQGQLHGKLLDRREKMKADRYCK